MKQVLAVLVFLFLMIGCVTVPQKSNGFKGTLLPPPPSSPGLSTSSQVGSAVGQAVPSWANTWADEPTDLVSPPTNFDKNSGDLELKITNHDLVWSKGYSINTKYVLEQQKSSAALNPLSVWTSFDVQIPATGKAFIYDSSRGNNWIEVATPADTAFLSANGGWIQVSRETEVLSSINPTEFEINTEKLVGATLFACKSHEDKVGYKEFDCHGKDGPVQIVSGTTLKEGSGHGAWMLHTLDLLQQDPPAVRALASTNTLETATTWTVPATTDFTLSPLSAVDGKFSISTAPLTVSAKGYDLFWSQGYYFDKNNAWTAFDLKQPDGSIMATPGWIKLSARTAVVSADIAQTNFEINGHYGVALFACKNNGPKEGYAEYDCNGIDSPTTNVKGDGTLDIPNNFGAWLLKTFDVASASGLLPPAPETPGTCTPTAEVCNGLDDNCDGVVDNGLVSPTQACTVGVGACARTGAQTKTCNGVSGWSAFEACSATAGAPSPEIKNGIDDNCNGKTDELLGTTTITIIPTNNLGTSEGTAPVTFMNTGGEWYTSNIFTCNPISTWTANQCITYRWTTPTTVSTAYYRIVSTLSADNNMVNTLIEFDQFRHPVVLDGKDNNCGLTETTSCSRRFSVDAGGSTPYVTVTLTPK